MAITIPKRPPNIPVSITIQGFKAIATRTRLELGKLTVLAGANSSGKSSLIQPLLLLKQTIEAPFDAQSLRLDGPNVYFSRAEQMFSVSGDGAFTVSLDFAANSDELGFRLDKSGRLMFGVNRIVRGASVFEFGIDTASDVLATIARTVYPEMAIKKAELASWRCGWQIDVFHSLSNHGPTKDFILGFPGALSSERAFTALLKNLIHVPGLRGRPERNYPLTAVGQTFSGPFDSYVASIVMNWAETKDARLKVLAKHLSELGLSWKVTAERIDDVQVELRVGRLRKPLRGGARDMVSIADVGIGVSQVLPVLVALLTAREDQAVFIEQPEIHLHPRAQRALATALVEAALRGVRVIVETHSHLLLTELQRRVARGDFVDPADVKLHWLSRDDKTGRTRIDTAELTSAGGFGDWPMDFDDVLAETQDSYIAEAHARLKADSLRK